MTPIRQILVPVDFSEPSRDALDRAAELGKAFGAKLDVLHVWEAPVFLPAGTLAASSADHSLVDAVRRHAEDSLDRFVEDAAKRGIEIRTPRALPGAPAQTIVETAETGGYDLVVIGTHGRTGLARALIGSVAERVVRHAPCPVLAVRNVPKA